jgi:hypothetical protein
MHCGPFPRLSLCPTSPEPHSIRGYSNASLSVSQPDLALPGLLSHRSLSSSIYLALHCVTPGDHTWLADRLSFLILLLMISRHTRTFTTCQSDLPLSLFCHECHNSVISHHAVSPAHSHPHPHPVLYGNPIHRKYDRLIIPRTNIEYPQMRARDARVTCHCHHHFIQLVGFRGRARRRRQVRHVICPWMDMTDRHDNPRFSGAPSDI